MFQSLSIRICLGVLIATGIAEAAVLLFRGLPRKGGDGAVYSWVDKAAAVPVEDYNTKMAREAYRSDRGGQWKVDSNGEKRVSIYYFEWDELETAPTMVLDGHHAELCNEAAGFKLLERLPSRFLEAPDGDKVEFDFTRFKDPAGHVVYLFKNVWLANTGNWDLRHKSRGKRLQLSFVRRKDAARVLQAGVYSARDADEAWEIFRSEILSHLAWNQPQSSN